VPRHHVAPEKVGPEVLGRAVGNPVPHGDGGEQVRDDDRDVERLQMHEFTLALATERRSIRALWSGSEASSASPLGAVSGAEGGYSERARLRTSMASSPKYVTSSRFQDAVRRKFERYSWGACGSSGASLRTAKARLSFVPRKRPSWISGSFWRRRSASSTPSTSAVTRPDFSASPKAAGSTPSSTFFGGTLASATTWARLVAPIVPTRSWRSSSSVVTAPCGLRVGTTVRGGKTPPGQATLALWGPACR